MDGAGPTKRIGENSTNTGLAARMSRLNGDGAAGTPSAAASAAPTEKLATRKKLTARRAPTPREGLVTTRGADELLARAREAGVDDDGPDESTLSAVQSLLRDF